MAKPLLLVITAILALGPLSTFAQDLSPLNNQSEQATSNRKPAQSLHNQRYRIYSMQNGGQQEPQGGGVDPQGGGMGPQGGGQGSQGGGMGPQGGGQGPRGGGMGPQGGGQGPQGIDMGPQGGEQDDQDDSNQ